MTVNLSISIGLESLPRKTVKILLVDDDITSIQALYELLDFHHDVHYAQDGHKALEWFATVSFDLVVTDFNMPGMTGIDLLEAVHKCQKDMRVIIITGYADVENAIAAVNHGAYAFFRKPLDIQDFMKTIGDVEQEIKGLPQVEIDHKQLADEFIRLKQAYESLQSELKQLQGGQPT